MILPRIIPYNHFVVKLSGFTSFQLALGQSTAELTSGMISTHLRMMWPICTSARKELLILHNCIIRLHVALGHSPVLH